MPCFVCLCVIFDAGAISLQASKGVHEQSLDPQLQARLYSWYSKVISCAYEKAKHWSYTLDTPILLEWKMIYILGRKPLNTSHESHQSKWSKYIVCDFWQQVSHIKGIEELLVFAMEGREWRQCRHLGAVLSAPHKSSSSTDTDYDSLGFLWRKRGLLKNGVKNKISPFMLMLTRSWEWYNQCIPLFSFQQFRSLLSTRLEISEVEQFASLPAVVCLLLCSVK